MTQVDFFDPVVPHIFGQSASRTVQILDTTRSNPEEK